MNRISRILLFALDLIGVLVLLYLNLPSKEEIVQPPGSGWTLIFSDDFTGENVNSTYWNTQYWFGRTNQGNLEFEWYQDDEVFVQNGILRLKAQRRAVHGYKFSSGMISSHEKVSFTYGYVELRARVPKGTGLWPAFWLLPSSKIWPPEIDVFEIVGSQTNNVLFHLHYADSVQRLHTIGSAWVGPDFAEGWHVFAIDWEPNSITWYVNGVVRSRYVGPRVPHEPMYLVANLAVGGSTTPPSYFDIIPRYFDVIPGYFAIIPDYFDTIPSYFDIDYIRVWQQ